MSIPLLSRLLMQQVDEDNDRKARRVSFGGINSNGSVRVPMTAINSNDDIVRMMFENGLIKDDHAYNTYLDTLDKWVTATLHQRLMRQGLPYWD